MEPTNRHREDITSAITKTYLNPYDYTLIYKHPNLHVNARNIVLCDAGVLIDFYTETYTAAERSLTDKLAIDDSPDKFKVIARYLLTPAKNHKNGSSFIEYIKKYEYDHYTYGFFGNKCLNTICNEIDTAISNYCKNKQRKDDKNDKNFKPFIDNVINKRTQDMKSLLDKDAKDHGNVYKKYNLKYEGYDGSPNEDNLLKSVIITNKLKTQYEISDKYYSNGYLIAQRIKLIISIDMLCIFHSYKNNTKKVQKYIDLKNKYLNLIALYINDPNSLTCPEGFIAILKRGLSRIGGGKKLTKPKVKKLTKPKVEKPTKPKVEKPTKPKVKKPTKPKVKKPTKPKVKKPTKPKVKKLV